MKKIALFLTTMSLALGIFSFSAAYAANPVNVVCTDSNVTAGSASSSPLCQDTSSSQLNGSNTLVNLIVNLISAIAAFVAVVIIIISGIQFINSGGDSKKVSQAKDTILYAAIGLIVIVLARIIIGFVLQKVS